MKLGIYAGRNVGMKGTRNRKASAYDGVKDDHNQKSIGTKDRS